MKHLLSEKVREGQREKESLSKGDKSQRVRNKESRSKSKKKNDKLAEKKRAVRC